MSDEQKTVFISYRWESAAFHARAIFQDLHAHGYDVFMDVESIDSGQLEQIIFNQIEARAHFLVILTPGTVERFGEANDMMRREIEFAMEKQRNIVPILIKGFSFSEAQPYLTGKLVQISGFSGVPVSHEYFPQAMERLRTRFLKQPIYGVIKDAPASEQAVVERKIEKAATQPTPTEKQLSAEEYFHRAYRKERAGDLDGAITDYDESIRLNPYNASTYNNRGIPRDSKGDHDGAIADFSEAIRLIPYFAEAYCNRGVSRRNKGDYNGAIADYSEAIHLNPRFAEAYFNRAVIHDIKGELTAAIDDYSEAIRWNLRRADAYYNRGNARYKKGDFDGAIDDYNKAIDIDSRYAGAYGNRGLARSSKGDIDGAIDDYNVAIRLNPQDGIAYFNRGIAHGLKGDHERAIDDITRTIQINPLDAEAYYNRGIVRQTKSDFQGAIEDYRRFLDFDIGKKNPNRYKVEQEIWRLQKALNSQS